MFNILLMPVAVFTYWEWSLVGLALFIIKDLSEIRSQILEEIRVETIDKEYEMAERRWEEEERKNR